MERERSLGAMHPATAANWHPTRNGAVTPFDVSPGSDRRVWWQCPTGHEWDGRVGSRVRRSTCPFCSGRRVTPETSLATLHPQVAAEWHPTRNGDRRAVDVRPGSGKPVWWRCTTCGHEWVTSPNNRANNNSGCPECARAFWTRSNAPLSVTHPDIAAQWHPTRNDGLTAADVTYGSSRRVWWQCDTGHEWQVAVEQRTRSRSKCPDCAGRRPSAERNLATVAPGLAVQWHPTLNGPRSPRDVLPSTPTPVWWQCDQGHEWRASPHSRRYGIEAGCPHCSRRS